MKTPLYIAAVAVATVSLVPGLSQARKEAVPLDAPENVACTIIPGDDTTDGTVLVEWDAVDGANKYAVSFDCQDPTGMMETDVEFDEGEEEGGDNTDTTAEVPFPVFDEAGVVLSGDGAWACLAKVKGLNPPGRRQNHPQGVALCEEEL